MNENFDDNGKTLAEDVEGSMRVAVIAVGAGLAGWAAIIAGVVALVG